MFVVIDADLSGNCDVLNVVHLHCTELGYILDLIVYSAYHHYFFTDTRELKISTNFYKNFLDTQVDV